MVAVMNVLFKNIPIGIKDFELAKFIEENFNIAKDERERMGFHCGCIEMLEKQDNFTHPIEQFGLVRISPPDIAQEVIRQLDGLIFDHCRITVRKFFSRSGSNDPRLKRTGLVQEVSDRRTQDRRKHFLMYPRQI